MIRFFWAQQQINNPRLRAFFPMPRERPLAFWSFQRYSVPRLSLAIKRKTASDYRRSGLFICWGLERIRTAVEAFAELCLATRPRDLLIFKTLQHNPGSNRCRGFCRPRRVGASHSATRPLEIGCADSLCAGVNQSNKINQINLYCNDIKKTILIYTRIIFYYLNIILL